MLARASSCGRREAMGRRFGNGMLKYIPDFSPHGCVDFLAEISSIGIASNT